MAGTEQRYSNEDMLEQLRDHYKRNSGISKRSFDSDKSVCSVSAVSSRFGSWAKGLQNAGFNVKELRS